MTISCWGCGIAKEPSIKGPPGLIVCYDCVLANDGEADLPFDGRCSFCGKRIGPLIGWFRRRRLRACIVRGSSALCNECLELMRDVINERAADEG
jgi:NMD protein affecting ribosome stability and mRNA decay